tara:strand:+ start:233 stop:490 length:258 start_codon:yes stop_codon:yes gene_type:complete
MLEYFDHASTGNLTSRLIQLNRIDRIETDFLSSSHNDGVPINNPLHLNGALGGCSTYIEVPINFLLAASHQMDPDEQSTQQNDFP